MILTESRLGQALFSAELEQVSRYIEALGEASGGHAAVFRLLEGACRLRNASLDTFISPHHQRAKHDFGTFRKACFSAPGSGVLGIRALARLAS
ncbi:hypothetical protein NDU88_007302 [Pleurodeles waltl]|uniref:Uncharacterized protein n=1 Tax=Pleurodeles waltl TaxID=8319 RepID=A0AAV7NT89_PLEWA|nr:hypothetical protein NDU88_007302 [Pleurodeles waltl]